MKDRLSIPIVPDDPAILVPSQAIFHANLLKKTGEVPTGDKRFIACYGYTIAHDKLLGDNSFVRRAIEAIRPENNSEEKITEAETKKRIAYQKIEMYCVVFGIALAVPADPIIRRSYSRNITDDLFERIVRRFCVPRNVIRFVLSGFNDNYWKDELVQVFQ